MKLAPRSPSRIVIALFLFLAVLGWGLMQLHERPVNDKGLSSAWLDPQTWLMPLGNHKALGRVGFNVGILKGVNFIGLQHGWAVGEDGVIVATDSGGKTWQDQSIPLLKAIGEGQPKLAVFPSPLALLLLLITGTSLVWQVHRYWAEPRSLQGGISDAPIDSAADDCLGRLELVKTLADLIRNRDTVPPLAIAITAAWGSGKSSLLGLLQDELQGEVFSVQLNAWHYRDDGALLAAIMEHIREVVPPLLSVDNLIFRIRLLWLRCFAGSGFRHLFALLVAVMAVIFFAGQQQWHSLSDWLSRELPALIPSWLKPFTAEPWFKLVVVVLASSLIYRLLKSWLEALSAFSPELVALATRLGKSTREAMQLAYWSKDAGLRFRFAQDFENVTQALGKGRLLLLIDDLDRCEPKQIESVMATLNFLFSTPAPCYAVLAMDWGYVTDALGLAFKDLAIARADTDAKGKAFATHYLEKIIQISIDLPAVNGSSVALIDHSQQTVQPVVNWWDTLRGRWAWLSYTPSQRLARWGLTVLLSPLRLLVSVVWRVVESGLWFVWQAIKSFNSKLLLPVYDGVLIVMLTVGLAWSAVQLSLIAQDFSGKQLKSARTQVIKPVVVKHPKKNKHNKHIAPPPKIATAAPVVIVDEPLHPTHYWLGEIAGVFALILLLMVWRLSLRVQDTQVFIEVMGVWQAFLTKNFDTPRDWKRLLNRARLFAMRVRVNQEKPWYADLDEKWCRLRWQTQPVLDAVVPLDERLAMHLMMADVYSKGELVKNLPLLLNTNDGSWQTGLGILDNNDLSWANFAILNDFIDLLAPAHKETPDGKQARAQFTLWLSLHAGLK